MARPIQYGDPGVVDWWKKQLAKSMQFSYDPFGGAGGVSPMRWLGEQYKTAIEPPEQYWPGGEEQADLSGPIARFRMGAGLGGAMGYDPTQEMQYMGLGSALPSTGIGTRRGAGPIPREGGLSPYISDAGLASTPGLLASTQPVQYGPPLPPEKGATPTGGQGEPIDYEYIRDMEQWLKETGQTGRTVPTYDEQGNITSIIRRDNQGRILRITRGTPKGTSRIGWGQPTKGQRNRYGSFLKTKEQSRYFARREQQRKEAQEPEPEPTPRSTYPDWVINMSNWRGI